jgi:hypothetical protein
MVSAYRRYPAGGRRSCGWRGAGDSGAASRPRTRGAGGTAGAPAGLAGDRRDNGFPDARCARAAPTSRHVAGHGAQTKRAALASGPGSGADQRNREGQATAVCVKVGARRRLKSDTPTPRGSVTFSQCDWLTRLRSRIGGCSGRNGRLGISIGARSGRWRDGGCPRRRGQHQRASLP